MLEIKKLSSSMALTFKNFLNFNKFSNLDLRKF